MENNSLNYQQLINGIQLLTLNDPTSPAAGSQEFIIYSQMIGNLAIPTWENERGTLWNELWVPVANGGTIQASTSSFALPDDFKFIGDGFVWINYPNGTATVPQRRPFPVKMLPEYGLNEVQNRPQFYISGNAINGFTLLLGWIPQAGSAEIGATISYRYYKHASIPTYDSSGNVIDLADVPEMSDPNFIMYKVSAQVSANNFNSTLYQIMEDKANYSLLNMRMANDMASNFMDDYVKDIDGLVGNYSSIPNRYSSNYWNGLGPFV